MVSESPLHTYNQGIMNFKATATSSMSAVATTTTAFVGLIAGSVALATTPVQAATIQFGNDGIKFDTDTAVNFLFDGSNGEYQSTLGFVNVSGNTVSNFTPVFSENSPGYDVPSTGPDFNGTCGITITASCSKTFTFTGGQEYSLALSSTFNGTNAGTVYSTSRLNTLFGNPASQDQAKFDGAIAFSGFDPTKGAVKVVFDDRGHNNDRDFNDFRVSVSASSNTASVPEPTTKACFGVVAAALVVSRRLQASKRA